MKLIDQLGNSVSTRNRKALELYDTAVAQLNVFRVDPMATIESALAEDPSFVMAHAFKAGVLLTTSERGAESAIAAALDAAAPHLQHALDRELAHLQGARAWLTGDFAAAAAIYGGIAAEHPRDLLALQIAHLCDFLLGNTQMLRDRPAQALRAWGERETPRGIVLGMHAFGLEECGNWPQAEIAGRRAIELNPADAWAAHAVAHVMEMSGRTREGIEWLEATSAGWSEQNFFAFHNWWHVALFHLENEDHVSALAVYDTRIRPVPSRVAMEMVDASALLWRLHLRGADVGDRWGELAQSWQTFGEDGYYAFNDVHGLMAFLATGNDGQVRRVLQSLEAAAKRPDTNGMMSREVGLPMAHALRAFAQGDYDVTIDELQRVRGFASRFGGSHAQRDLLQLTATEAALRAGKRSLARALIAERLAAKPRSEFNRRLVQRTDYAGGQSTRAA
jgi:tetratricopeptide (TPR) repeat protein